MKVVGTGRREITLTKSYGKVFCVWSATWELVRIWQMEIGVEGYYGGKTLYSFEGATNNLL